jgi:hypothetical protein
MRPRHAYLCGSASFITPQITWLPCLRRCHLLFGGNELFELGFGQDGNA